MELNPVLRNEQNEQISFVEEISVQKYSTFSDISMKNIFKCSLSIELFSLTLLVKSCSLFLGHSVVSFYHTCGTIKFKHYAKYGFLYPWYILSVPNEIQNKTKTCWIAVIFSPSPTFVTLWGNSRKELVHILFL